jgi:hypothetical protein
MTTSLDLKDISQDSASVKIPTTDTALVVDADVAAGAEALNAVLIVLETSDLSQYPPIFLFTSNDTIPPFSVRLGVSWGQKIYVSSPHTLRIYVFDESGMFGTDSCVITFTVPE